jgi:hypothetical protein
MADREYRRWLWLRMPSIGLHPDKGSTQQTPSMTFEFGMRQMDLGEPYRIEPSALGHVDLLERFDKSLGLTLTRTPLKLAERSALSAPLNVATAAAAHHAHQDRAGGAGAAALPSVAPPFETGTTARRGHEKLTVGRRAEVE